MDYVTRQFINLAKKLRDDLRKGLSSLRIDLQHIKEAIESVNKNHEADKDKKTAPQEMVAVLHEPKPTEDERRGHDTRIQRRDRVRLLIEGLTLIAVTFYGYMAVRQWREQISARHQVEQAIVVSKDSSKTAKEALIEVQRSFVFVNNIQGNAIGTGKVDAISFRFEWENSGSTPTKTMQTHISYRWQVDPLTNKFDFPVVCGDSTHKYSHCHWSPRQGWG